MEARGTQNLSTSDKSVVVVVLVLCELLEFVFKLPHLAPTWHKEKLLTSV